MESQFKENKNQKKKRKKEVTNILSTHKKKTTWIILMFKICIVKIQVSPRFFIKFLFLDKIDLINNLNQIKLL